MIKYEARFGKVKKVEIKRETAAFVILPDGRREGKDTEWSSYFDTAEQAKQHLIDQSQVAVEVAQQRLKYAQDQLSNAKGIKI